jgi:predicted nucleic acid-binding Zn ribbon protein
MRYDVRCEECNREFEVVRHHSEPNPPCDGCGSGRVHTIWKSVPILEKAKDPYDYLDGPIPSGKKIFSGPKVSSKTTT